MYCVISQYIFYSFVSRTLILWCSKINVTDNLHKIMNLVMPKVKIRYILRNLLTLQLAGSGKLFTLTAPHYSWY